MAATLQDQYIMQLSGLSVEVSKSSAIKQPGSGFKTVPGEKENSLLPNNTICKLKQNLALVGTEPNQQGRSKRLDRVDKV